MSTSPNKLGRTLGRDGGHGFFVGFEFPFLGWVDVALRWKCCPSWKDCYSKNLHTDEPEVQNGKSKEKARYAHRGSRFGVCGVGNGSVFCGSGARGRAGR